LPKAAATRPTKRPITRTLANIGEHGFLSKILPLQTGSTVVIGAGDDCAVLANGRGHLLLTVDALVEGVHFRLPWQTPFQLGRKSFLVNASDVAAMGGQPRHAVVAIAAPGQVPVRTLERIQAGIVAAARDFGAQVVGGNLTRAAEVSITITLTGTVESRFITRSGARVGDDIYVTGRLGDAALGLAWLTGDRRGQRPTTALRRFFEPIPRVETGRILARSSLASAMIDVSDGLVQDLGHLCRQSGCAATILVDRVPRPRALAARPHLALHGGEDYELLFTAAPSQAAALEHAGLGCKITRIGTIEPPRPGKHIRLLRDNGDAVQLGKDGFDHFQVRSPLGRSR